MRFSIILTNYNYGEYLLNCLVSIELQEFTDFEVILVDDCSTDAISKKILSHKFPPYYRVVRNSENRGVCKSRNEALKMCNGEFILHIDADDFLVPGFLYNLDKVISENPGREVIRYHELVYSEKLRAYAVIGNLPQFPEFNLKGRGFWISPISSVYDMVMQDSMHGNFVYSRRAYETLGGFREEFIHGWEDAEFHIRYVRKFGVLNPDPILEGVVYRVDKPGSSREKSFRESFSKILETCQILFRYIPEYCIYGFRCYDHVIFPEDIKLETPKRELRRFSKSRKVLSGRLMDSSRKLFRFRRG